MLQPLILPGELPLGETPEPSSEDIHRLQGFIEFLLSPWLDEWLKLAGPLTSLP